MFDLIRITLKEVVKQKGYTLTDVAMGTGISMNTLSVLGRNGSKGIQFETLEKICRYLDVTPNDILKLSTDEYVVSLSSQRHDSNWAVLEVVSKTVLDSAISKNMMYNATENEHQIFISHTGENDAVVESDRLVQFFVGLPMEISQGEVNFNSELAGKWLQSLDEDQQESICRQSAYLYIKHYFKKSLPDRVYVAYNSDGTGGRIYPFWVGQESGKLVRLTFQDGGPVRPADLK